jgi:hypothetical protein
MVNLVKALEQYNRDNDPTEPYYLSNGAAECKTNLITLSA